MSPSRVGRPSDRGGASNVRIAPALAAFSCLTSLNFFRGVRLEPVPTGGGVKDDRRAVDETLADVDEAQVRSWVRQAAALPGWLAPPSRGGP